MDEDKRKIIKALLLVAIIILFLNFLYGTRPVLMGKPNIYLYPEKEQNVSVKLDTKGIIKTSIPKYNDGWNVRVKPNGDILGGYRFLFYEAYVKYPFKLEKGWVIRKDEFSNKMREILELIGLNKTEEKDFMEYWSKKLDWSYKQYAVYYIPQKEIDNAVKLTVSGNPESVLRVLFYFVPLKKYGELEAPDIHHFARKGFTVVEWGGIID